MTFSSDRNKQWQNSHPMKIIKFPSPAYGQADGKILIPIETWQISRKNINIQSKMGLISNPTGIFTELLRNKEVTKGIRGAYKS